MQTPAIKAVEIKKEGRFWALRTDGELLAVVLYKNGAKAVQQTIQRLAGLPVDGEEPTDEPKGRNGKAGKRSDKASAKGKAPAKKAVKSTEPVQTPAESTVIA